ncbi:hypothetical protein TNCV_326361 [Trichonephila clavipes]|nr:hypothetical protein TNCV_326361 [Trichonephila clavipes]
MPNHMKVDIVLDCYEGCFTSHIIDCRSSYAVLDSIETELYFVENDEAHFWLNGYVNKQNCRIWSEANSQVYVETPLHPEKLTVWCAL